MYDKVIKTAQILAKPRDVDDICLVNRITQVMQAAGHPAADFWMGDQNIAKAARSNPQLQMLLISNYWRLMLGVQQEDTQSARFCLSAITAKPDEYLSIFSSNVVPVIIALRIGYPSCSSVQ